MCANAWLRATAASCLHFSTDGRSALSAMGVRGPPCLSPLCSLWIRTNWMKVFLRLTNSILKGWPAKGGRCLSDSIKGIGLFFGWKEGYGSVERSVRRTLHWIHVFQRKCYAEDSDQLRYVDISEFYWNIINISSSNGMQCTQKIHLIWFLITF